MRTENDASGGRRRIVLGAVLAVVLVVVAAGVIFRLTEDDTAAIPAPPAFTASDLAEPAANWVTNGGSTMNQRYSPLTQITSSNVKNLKGVWRTHLKSATAAKYSGEGQPIVWKGVMYVTTGNDDVSAISVKTGKVLWEHKSNISQEINTICCGWLNRGVAVGDGKVYLGQLDGKVVALRQSTGEVAWSKQLVQWQKGATITGAPLYMDGKLYIGIVGADYGVRAFMQQMDAKTGAQGWRWYTVPAPGEPGGESWPKGSTAYLRGGASIWGTPAVDRKLGLMYFSTGNAGNDWYGGARAGKNLYSASIVALDYRTGTFKWAFQEVHHDIWDYDAASPVVLFDAKSAKSGKDIQGIGQPGKTGWLYLLDRTNGKPLYGVDEKKVPQDSEQKTWPTQPFPRTSQFTPHGRPSAANIARVKKEATGAIKKAPVVIAKEIFVPPPVGKNLIYGPGPMGGNNWEPSSYDPKTHMFYVCAASQVIGVMAANLPFKEGQSFSGVGGIAGIGYSEATGSLTAIDATTGKVAWQKRWPDPCYSGTVTTGSNLVFVGRNSGEYQAFDGKTGKQLWSFQTGAGANSTGTIFEQDGQQYIALLSAGNSLVASPHGDSVWLFGLNGKMGPAPAPGSGAGTNHQGEDGGQTQTGNDGDVAAGKAVFSDNCAGCHGLTGHGGNGGPDLTAIPSAKTPTRVKSQVTNGGGGMPPFKGQLTPKEIKDVTAYVTKQITNANK